jgi:hypothetical protein
VIDDDVARLILDMLYEGRRRETYPQPEWQAARRVAARGVRPSRVSELLSAAETRPYWRGRIATCQQLEQRWDQLEAECGASASTEGWQARQPPSPPQSAGRDMDTWVGGVTFSSSAARAAFEVSRARWADKIHAAAAAGLTGRALASHVLRGSGVILPNAMAEADAEAARQQRQRQRIALQAITGAAPAAQPDAERPIDDAGPQPETDDPDEAWCPPPPRVQCRRVRPDDDEH